MDFKNSLDTAQPALGKEVLSDAEHSASGQNSDGRTILFKYENWRLERAEVTDALSQEKLCTVDYKVKKPQIRFHSSTDETPFATSTFHLFTSRIDVELHGQAVELKMKKHLKMDYSYASVAMPGQTLTWTSKCGFSSLDCVCVNEQQLPVARFVSNAWTHKKVGAIEVLEPAASNPAAKEEIMVMGLTMAYYIFLATKMNIGSE